LDDFSEFYAAQFHPLTTQLLAHTGDLATAQDLVQEAFSRAVPRWSRLRGYDDPAAWVRRVAFNLAKSRWRRQRLTRRRSAQGRDRDEYVAGPGPDRVALVRALSTLPENRRRAVVLHYLAGLTVVEIADMENTSSGTVKSWLHRGRAALADRLRDSREANHV
jgi:RNA polymerase sigma-70 factor (ECF subfamily)